MSDAILKQLFTILEERKNANPESSYVAGLYQLGTAKIAQKVGEEAVETVIEAMRLENGQSDATQKLCEESADLMFHLMVLWAHLDVTPEMVLSVLESRLNKSGLNRGQ
jgi:phosphoribosyl-ATP pyrophosphohydrolase